MALWRYAWDALGARWRAGWWRLAWGVQAGARAKVHRGVRWRGERGALVLGAGAELYPGTALLCTRGGRLRLGAGSHIAPGGHLLVGGQVLDIGDAVAIGPQVAIFCESNGTAAGAPFVAQRVAAPVRIGRNVFLGARVTVLPGAVIEDGVVVAAHAVVRGRLASGWVYGGVPAQPLHRLRADQGAPAAAAVAQDRQA
ncbi:acyltransferase [Ideonella livida]|uniref:Acyltransferase n=1 Tax=Ideonella livida TaxID=2707176 RepID=A0A7C9TLH0_9BURK|nr:DapH/DapD/GlmU-related protein [Ideonella livida]NDY92602.1 acyltransferase [Ideonella livida]